MMTGYVHWCDGTGRRRRWWAVLTVVSIVVGGGYGWPAFYLAGIIFAFDWLWRRRFDLKLLLLTIVPAVLTGAAVIGHIAWAFGGLDHLWAVAMHRSSELGDVTLLGWLRAQAVFALRNYGIMTAALSPIVGFFVASRVRAERFSLRTMVIAAFAVWGLAHVLLFRNGSYIHDYWQYYLTPFMAAGLAWLLTAMARRLLPSALPRAALLLVLCAGVLLGNVPQIISHYGTTLEWTRTGVESPLFPFNSRNWHAESLARRAAPGCLNRAPTPALCRRRAATTLGALFLSLGRGLGLRWRRRG